MSVLDRAELEQSPLADLHTLASEFSIDSYRRLRRAELIDRILGRQLDDPMPAPPGDPGAGERAGAVGRAAEGEEEAAALLEGEEGVSAAVIGDGEDVEARARPRRTRRSTGARSVESEDATQERDESGGEESKSEDKAPAKPRAQTGRTKAATGRARAGGGRAKKVDEAPAQAVGTEGLDEATDAVDVAVETRGATADARGGASKARGTASKARGAASKARGARGAASKARGAASRERGAAAAEAQEADDPGRKAIVTADGGQAPEADDGVAEGVVELLASGSGFVRVQPPEPSDDDVYISAAQVKRCELVTGDRISGPRRAPRRSERFASLLRVDTINGRPATEVADGARFDDLPAAFPDERFRLGSEDPTVKTIEWLTPIGRGSRVTIVGGARAGKTDALRRLAAALAGHEELQVSVALAGVRPEEIPEWSGAPVAPAASLSFGAPTEAQAQAVEAVIAQARRVAVRGADAVVLVDTLDGLQPNAARRVMACARNIVDGGSLTVIATAAAPVGGETTVIALDAALASVSRFPALDLTISGTMRPELLVGDAGAEAIARARAEVIDS